MDMRSPQPRVRVMMGQTRKLLLLVQAVLVMATAMPTQVRSQEKSRSAAAFHQLASLVGGWEGMQDGVQIKLTYTLTANGTALMEHMQPGNSPVMITMFTVDGDHLIATHYCSAGNQPQMATGTPGDLEKNRLTFSLVRVTGLKTPDDWHNTGLTLILDDKDHMTQRWTYLYKGKAGTTIFHYARSGRTNG